MDETPNVEATNTWNASLYDGSHSFVYEHGEGLIELFDPQPGERILDLGCGTGHLTSILLNKGADVIGLDSSMEMLDQAQSSYPDCRFVCGDARNFEFGLSFDAVFSNAVFHWIPEQDQSTLLKTVRDHLVSDGRLVAELGGNRNVQLIRDAVQDELASRGVETSHPWYFPSIGEYAQIIESCGLELQYARLFDRPTKLTGGEEGLASWLGMFGDSIFEPLSTDEQTEVVRAVEDSLREDLFESGEWIADYRRLRFVAVRSEADFEDESTNSE